MAKTPNDLLHGTLDILILKALTLGPTHGYSVSRWIEDRTDGLFAIEDAALYKALHRLEGQGVIESDWGISDTNRRAKYYRLTPRGRAALRAETLVWHQYAGAVSAVLRGADR